MTRVGASAFVHHASTLIISSRHWVDLVGRGQGGVKSSNQRVPAILRALAQSLHQLQLPRRISLHVIAQGGPGWRTFPAFSPRQHIRKTGFPSPGRASMCPIAYWISQRLTGKTKGAVPIGQPGVCASLGFPPRVTIHERIRCPGKTTFSQFMLVQLISAH